MEKAVNSDFLNSITDPVALYENAPCGYLSFTADGKIIKINQTLLDWLGYTREEVVHQLYFKDLISKGGQIYYEMFYFPLLLIQNQVNEINFDHVRSDKSRFPALINSNVINDSNGRLLAVNATVYNITDRKKYENELLESKRIADAERKKFESLADFLPELIWTADGSGSINYVNRRFAEFFGLPSGLHGVDLILPKVHKADRFKLVRNWLRVVHGEKSFQIEVRMQGTDQLYQWYLIRALANEQLDGSSKWIGSCTNIDEHVNTIQQLDEFISIASHELKTPITSLKASLQLMRKFISSENGSTLSKLQDQSNKAIEKINNLVENLLNTSNIKEGQISLNNSRFNVCSLLSNTCPHVQAEGSHNLVIDCAEDIYMYGDEHRLDQVLVNFVNNAIKYAPESKDIFLSAEHQNNNIKISVRDTGPGIPAAKLPHVFERYFRVNHADANSGYTGLGLGLYICSEIIRRHGGRIGVDSELNKGTTFWFSIPVIATS